jgi:hypothetical protein
MPRSEEITKPAAPLLLSVVRYVPFDRLNASRMQLRLNVNKQLDSNLYERKDRYWR